MADARSFDEFVRDHQQALTRYAALLCQSTAQGEDMVQDVLIRMYQRWDQVLRGSGSRYAYARRAVTNEYLSWRRRWSTRHIRVAEEGELDRVAVDPWGGDGDDELWEHLRRLPRQQRTAVVLRFYEGLDDDEIAGVMGCRQGTVRAHISRGLAALRTAIGTTAGQRMAPHE